MNSQPSRFSFAPLMLACAVAVAVAASSAHAQPRGEYEVTMIQTPVDCGFGYATIPSMRP